MAVALMSILIAGCTAQRSRDIIPEYIPASDYSHMSCADTEVMLAFKEDEETALSSGQDSAGRGILGLAHELVKMSNDEREKSIAKVKGEVNALRGAIRANCP
jgi:hypothetical protein